ncbi:high-affinity choline transporter 1-like [Dermacentor andersoni]|uniref:high-affinity choline transporter 1-like n=1 Tax=Dermacentor andersoni TaxID=34620 RepID=UPI003B3AC6A7
MAVSLVGALTIILYYIAVIAVGVWAGRKILRTDSPLTQSAKEGSPGGRLFKPSALCRTPNDNEYLLRLFIANRSVPLALSFLSMTATWVGGGYLNGTAEAVFNYGIVWCHAPIGYALSLVIGGRFFAGKMRVTKALTMFDPFQQHYGRWIAVPLCLPALCGEVFWTAAILAALGDTVAAITRVDSPLVIVLSSAIILFYTSLGGLYSVIYTDTFQLVSSVFGLVSEAPPTFALFVDHDNETCSCTQWVSVAFFLRSNTVGTIGPPHSEWFGSIDTSDVSQIVDQLLMAVFGGIPWQVYFQRVLCAESVFTAKMLSYLAAAGCCFLALPPIIIGARAKSCNFTAAGYQGPFNLAEGERHKVLPLALHYMTPKFVAVLGQLAITAAVMSSVDSSMLSASQLITRNIYHIILRPAATDMEVCVVLRCMVCFVGAVATSMALRVSSVFSLWALSSDLVYVLLFPQFVALFFLRHRTNAYGSVLGFFAGLVLRFLCGEQAFGLPALLRLPLYDSERGQQFPFRTLCMVVSLSSQLLGSAAAAGSFRASRFRDYWRCFEEVAEQPPDADAATVHAPCTALVPLFTPDDHPDHRHHEAAGAAPHNKAHHQQHHHHPHHEPPEEAAVGTTTAAGSVTPAGTATATGASEHAGGEEKAHRRSSSRPSEAGSSPKKAKRRRTSSVADGKSQGPQGSRGAQESQGSLAKKRKK